ncbi:testis-expressed protein 22 [Suncus etruscus]|uniref:testis-expressed protein 22 n=1 Tax=Suncus etruscus TaxID=109475 RepID=UPI00210F8E1D|nr:testis-expressed protein 22 [Suncus etruscus]
MEWAGPRSGSRVPGWRLPGVRAAPGSLRAAWPARFDQTPTAPGSRGTPWPEAGSGAAGEVGLHGCGDASRVPTAHGAQTKATPARSSCPQGLQTQDWVCELPQSRYQRRHWNTDIEERRQLALESPSPEKSILQTVSWLLSDGMDKDVLLPPMSLTAPWPARVSLTALPLSVLGACGTSNSPPF